MLITFKSSAGSNVTMFEKNAGELLNIVGKKAADRQGVITVDQLPAGIGALQAAIAAEKALPAKPEPGPDASVDLPEPTVTLVQRTLPLLDLLQRSLAEKEAVTWGV